MNIAIISPFNPTFVKELFDQEEIPDINRNATAVNILVAALVEQGHRVFVYTTVNTGSKMIAISGRGIEVRIISKEFHPHGMSNVRVVKRLRKAIAKDIDEIDIIHAHWTYEYAAAARHFEKLKPVFCTIRDWCPYQRSLAKGVAEKYSWWVNTILFSYVMKSNRIQFIANSTYTYNMAHKGYPNKRIEIIPNPVQHKFIIQKRKEKDKSDVFITICQSLEERRKNIDTLLKAFQLYRKERKDSTLVVVGNCTDEWKQFRQDLLPGVIMTGSIGHDEVYKCLDESDVLVHPSIEETFGNILLEAMARRVVCVGGEHAGAVPEVLGFGERGLICDVTNADDLAKTMKKAMNRDEVKSIVNNATSFLNDMYSDIAVARTHIRLYKGQLDNLDKKRVKS